MTLTVGRVVWPATGNVTATEGGQFDLSLGGLMTRDASMTAAQMDAWLWQVQTLAPDMIVPVIWSCRPTITGLYRIGSVSIGDQAGSLDAADPNQAVSWSIKLTRVAGGSARVQYTTTGGPRPTFGGAAYSGGALYSGVPGSKADGTGTATSTESGSVWRYSSTPGFVWTADADVRPSEWFAGAATIESQFGAEWVSMPGLSVPDGRPIRIGNGLVRFTIPVVSGATALSPLWEQWYGAGWWTPRTLNVASSGGLIGITAPISTEVLRNDPDEVRIRVTCRRVNLTSTEQVADARLMISVRRGVAMVVVCSEIQQLRWSVPGATGSLSATWRMTVSTPTGASSLVIATDRPVTVTATNAQVRQTTETYPSRWFLTPTAYVGDAHFWGAIDAQVVGQ